MNASNPNVVAADNGDEDEPSAPGSSLALLAEPVDIDNEADANARAKPRLQMTAKPKPRPRNEPIDCNLWSELSPQMRRAEMMRRQQEEGPGVFPVAAVGDEPPSTEQDCHQPLGYATVPEPDGEGYYAFEELLAYQCRDGKDYYLVKWTGSNDNTWEPDENIQSSRELDDIKIELKDRISIQRRRLEDPDARAVQTSDAKAVQTSDARATSSTPECSVCGERGYAVLQSCCSSYVCESRPSAHPEYPRGCLYAHIPNCTHSTI